MSFQVELCNNGSPEHRQALQQLEDVGVAVPECWRPDMGEANSLGERLVWVNHTHPTVPLGVPLRISRSRRVPWARIARLEHLGDPYLAEHASRVARLIRAGAHAIGRIMRLEVRVLHREAVVRDALATALRQEGAHVSPAASMYQFTRVIEVDGTTVEMFSRLPAVARRRVRQPINHGLLVRTNAAVENDTPRLLALMNAAFDRTGGVAQRDQWARDLARAVRSPEYNVLVTLEHADRTDDGRIVAFALGSYNGDHATYQHGASERGGGLGGLPLGYAPMWAMVEWGATKGARWIDLGGITTSDDPSHPLAGISAFKRQFGGQDALVAEELTFALKPTNIRLENQIGGWLQKSR